LLISPIGYIIEPLLVIQIPAYGFLNAFLKLYGRFPSEFIADLGCIDGVAQIVPGTIGHIGDQFLRCSLFPSQQAVNSFDNHPDKVDIFPFIASADIIGLSHPAPVKDQINGPRMVFHVKPVPDVLSLAIDRKRFVVTNIIDEERYQFFGKLIGSVIVGTIGNNDWQAIGVMISPYKVIG